jgi:hypothetical protein
VIAPRTLFAAELPLPVDDPEAFTVATFEPTVKVREATLAVRFDVYAAGLSQTETFSEFPMLPAYLARYATFASMVEFRNTDEFAI